MIVAKVDVHNDFRFEKGDFGHSNTKDNQASSERSVQCSYYLRLQSGEQTIPVNRSLLKGVCRFRIFVHVLVLHSNTLLVRRY